MNRKEQVDYNLRDYFRAQQVPLQWALILRALADTLRESAGSDVDSLRELLRVTGRRFAAEMTDSLEGAQTLEQLIEGLNCLWSEINWGLVELDEQPGHITIEHRFAPLVEAFGPENLTWSIGLLEGFYEAAFASVGASQAFKVRFAGEEDDGMRLILNFSAQQ